MRSISIEEITGDMTFKPAKAYSKVNVEAGKNHRIVRDEKANHIGIAYKNGESKIEWESYPARMVYFFWKQYETVQVVRSRQF